MGPQMPKLQQMLNFANNMESEEITKVLRRGAAAQNIANRNTFGFQGGINANKGQRLNSTSALVEDIDRMQSTDQSDYNYN